MGASPPVTQSQFEFRGVYQLDGDYYFHIYDQRSRRGSWIGYNTGSAGYPRIVEFEESMDRLTVELDGERLQLSMTNLHAGTAYAPGQQPATNSDVSLQSINPIRSTGPASRRPVLRSAPEPANGAVTRRVTFPTGQNTD